MCCIEEAVVSVIVPVYKTKDYLNRCVCSIVKQTYQNLQIILIDDGSPDECGEMCEEWARKDARISVIHKMNGGLSDARNVGIAHAEGDYITFVDSDDWIEADYVSYLMEGIRKHDAQVSVCNFFTVRNGNAKAWRKPDEGFKVVSSVSAVQDMMYGWSFDTSAWAKLYHRSCFDRVRFPVGRLYEEVATTYRFMLQHERIAVGMRPLYNYVKHPNSIVTGHFSTRSMDMLRASQEFMTTAQAAYPELIGAAKRRMVYACCYLYKTMGYTWKQYPQEVAELKKVYRTYYHSVLMDPKASMRDKAAIILLLFGVQPFEWAWGCYCILTGRERNAS